MDFVRRLRVFWWAGLLAGGVCSSAGDSLAALAEERGELRVSLVTVGPGSDLLELWGHSALCVSRTNFEDGICYDYGWSPERDFARLALGTLRGEPLFVPIEWPAKDVLVAYQFRDVWQQDLPLEGAGATRLVRELESDVSQKKGYPYEPLLDNCTTRLRDALDEAAGGRLERGGQGRFGPPSSQIAEAALRGRLVPLVLLELAGGGSLDSPTNEWARMGLPFGLMESVERHWGSKPQRLFTRRDRPLPTSSDAGRAALVLLAVFSALLVWRAERARGSVRRLARVTLGVWLAVLSVFPILGVASALPSLEPNWLLVVLVPTDLLLARGPGLFMSRYLFVRVATSGLVLGLSWCGLVAQSLWAPCFVALFPLLARLLADRRFGAQGSLARDRSAGLRSGAAGAERGT